jgi:hypothetical protein
MAVLRNEDGVITHVTKHFNGIPYYISKRDSEMVDWEGITVEQLRKSIKDCNLADTLLRILNYDEDPLKVRLDIFKDLGLLKDPIVKR